MLLCRWKVYCTGGMQTFELPKSRLALRDAFRAIVGAKESGEAYVPWSRRSVMLMLVASGELLVLDWGVTNATLEQAFLRIVAADMMKLYVL